jgi:hypothetical protein
MTKLLDEGNVDPKLDGKYNYENLKRWSCTRKSLERIYSNWTRSSSQSTWVAGIGWICAVAYMSEKRIQMYDSMGADGMFYLRIILQYIRDEHMEKKKSHPCRMRSDQWQKIATQGNTPKQDNGFDCGVFTTCMMRRGGWIDGLSQSAPKGRILGRNNKRSDRYSPNKQTNKQTNCTIARMGNRTEVL